MYKLSTKSCKTFKHMERCNFYGLEHLSTWKVKIGGPQFEPILGKKLLTHFLTHKPSVAVHLCNHSYMGGRSKRVKV